LLLVSPAGAATEPTENCSLADLGVHGPSEIRAFGGALRSALDQDPTTLAKLAQFPLSVTYPDGQQVMVHDAVALRNELNVPALHALERHLELPSASEPSCNGQGVSYADGRIIATPGGLDKAQILRITAINFQESLPWWTSTKIPGADLRCQTKTQRYVIQRTAYRNSYRFRVWNLPAGSGAKPFLDTDLGGSHVRTSGAEARPCGHYIRTWDFRGKGNGDWYSLSLPNCEDRGHAPENALASVRVSTRFQPQWCYPIPVMAEGAQNVSALRSSDKNGTD
jgi:hypothetical protein